MADRGVGGPAPPPHGAILAVVVGAVVAVPFLVGESAGEAITDAIAELLSPVGLLLLPVTLIILIRFLSSDRGLAMSDILSLGGGSPDSFHRVGGSPVGVALFLLLIMFLLYFKLFSGGDDDD